MLSMQIQFGPPPPYKKGDIDTTEKIQTKATKLSWI